MRRPTLALAALSSAALASIVSAEPAAAKPCAEVVDAIVRESGASRNAASDGSPWVALTHPSFTRITITCYGEETLPAAELVLEQRDHRDGEGDAFRIVGLIGQALMANDTADALTLEAKRCSETASAPAKIGEIEAASSHLSCLVTSSDAASQSAATLTIYISEGGTRAASTPDPAVTPKMAAAIPQKPVRLLQHRRSKAASKSFCPLFDP